MSRTATEVKREITRKGDVVTIKEIETITTYVEGKAPEVKEVTRVQEYKGEEGFKRLPPDVKRQLEQTSDVPAGKVNKTATKGKFVEDCWAEQNKYRKKHGVEPLKLSKELIKASEQRAKELAEKDEMTPRGDHNIGENLSCLWSSDPEHVVEASEIISRWYAESANYNYNEEPQDLNSGHFTQMIWERSKEFGIAAAKSNSNKIYVVASYSPPGNYVGEFKKNVHPPGYEKPPSGKASSGKASSSATSNADNKFQDKSLAFVINEASLNQFNKEGVISHNQYRSKHGVPPVKFSQELANYAQEWAEKLARMDKMEHRKERKYGENIYSFKSSDPNALVSAADACASWYSEIKFHDFNTEPKSLASGHFTQMIWKESTEVGMGMAKSKTGLQLVVANYNPPGNFVGNFKANVPPPLK